MNKKTLVIVILSAFIVAISAVNFTNAQVPVVPPPTCVPAEGIPCPDKPKETQAKEAVVSNNRGLVQILQPDGTWKNISPNTILKDGDQIRTGDGRVTITLSDGSTVGLAPHSLFKYKEIEGGFGIELLVGKIRAWVKRYRHKFEVRTPNVVVAVRGTDFIVDYSAEMNITKVYLYEGLVDVDNLHGKTLQMQPGDKVAVDGAGQMTSGKLGEGEWKQMADEIGLAETPGQTIQSDAAERESAAQTGGPATQEPATKPSGIFGWVGVIIVLLGAIGAGIIVYLKKRKSGT